MCGCFRSSIRTTENNRTARYYALTAAGRRQLRAEVEEWRRSVSIINRIIKATG